MSRRLTLGYSTCPNDTFLFYALAHKKVDCGDLDFDITLADVETLNQDARSGTFDTSKLSFAAIGHLQDTYGLLRSGAALGRGCGPLIITRPGFDPARLSSVKIAVPGLWTTACMLLGLYLEDPPDVVPMTFDRIMPAVAAGEYEAGVIIHEGRFTFGNYGLERLADLGEWWEEKTGLPIPLGGIAIRRDLGQDVARVAERAIRDSVACAFADRNAPAPYIRKYAQEMEDAVVQQHIDLYVNDFTLNLGPEGEKAVETLFRLAGTYGLIPRADAPLFACQ
ncbi:1,4-dihydroxy-6-naphthoate synthase [Desulfonema ishimotonii]|uniref:1,4-dihydroxy-6-naphtoate synthase n=1 Tax=Desulfonema ishimotonii TaxID=45657 RepID=A0A401G0R1_9BACT|nr:1,4-dihydroxy-6-naphthoate synthase [Desulfonema ishimotonii]GBC62818.1 1,4-dihydroxy-6-naphthoate synthase [Desulfonema ishimotonii]